MELAFRSETGLISTQFYMDEESALRIDRDARLFDKEGMFHQ